MKQPFVKSTKERTRSLNRIRKTFEFSLQQPVTFPWRESAEGSCILSLRPCKNLRLLLIRASACLVILRSNCWPSVSRATQEKFLYSLCSISNPVFCWKTLYRQVANLLAAFFSTSWTSHDCEGRTTRIAIIVENGRTLLVLNELNFIVLQRQNRGSYNKQLSRERKQIINYCTISGFHLNIAVINISLAPQIDSRRPNIPPLSFIR